LTIQEVPPLFLTEHYSCNLKTINLKLAIAEMYRWIPWDPRSRPWEPQIQVLFKSYVLQLKKMHCVSIGEGQPVNVMCNRYL
jgi:hypothetical protein